MQNKKGGRALHEGVTDCVILVRDGSLRAMKRDYAQVSFYILGEFLTEQHLRIRLILEKFIEPKESSKMNEHTQPGIPNFELSSVQKDFEGLIEGLYIKAKPICLLFCT